MVLYIFIHSKQFSELNLINAAAENRQVINSSYLLSVLYVWWHSVKLYLSPNCSKKSKLGLNVILFWEQCCFKPSDYFRWTTSGFVCRSGSRTGPWRLRQPRLLLAVSVRHSHLELCWTHRHGHVGSAGWVISGKASELPGLMPVAITDGTDVTRC